jgi:uncharacterized membrane protein YphA (DoxX/SURF4 family)
MTLPHRVAAESAMPTGWSHASKKICWSTKATSDHARRLFCLLCDRISSLYMNAAYIISRITLALIWLYHGLVPKLIMASEQEVILNEAFLPFLSKQAALVSTGIIEVVYSLALLVLFRNRWLLLPSLVFSSVITVVLLIRFPELFGNAFDPFSINLAVFALALINWFSCSDKIEKT